MRNKRIHPAIVFLFFLFLVGIDQLTKLCALTVLRDHSAVNVLTGIFELTYVENRGAAFGLLSDCRWIFMLGSAVILFFVTAVYLRLPLTEKYAPIRAVCVFLAAGAVGNMIDRIFRGYVIDFFYFSLIDFPVFNMADIYVVGSIAVFLYLFLFRYKEEDFSFLRRNERSDSL